MGRQGDGEGEPRRDRGRPHAFPELEPTAVVTLQSPGDSLLEPGAVSNDPPKTDPTFVPRHPPSDPSLSLPAFPSCGPEKRGSEPGPPSPRAGRLRGAGSRPGSSARALPAGARFGASRPSPHINATPGLGGGAPGWALGRADTPGRSEGPTAARSAAWRSSPG